MEDWQVTTQDWADIAKNDERDARDCLAIGFQDRNRYTAPYNIADAARHAYLAKTAWIRAIMALVGIAMMLGGCAKGYYSDGYCGRSADSGLLEQCAADGGVESPDAH